MKCPVFALVLCLCVSSTSGAQQRPSALPDAPKAQPGIIVGTVVDVNDDAIPGAIAVLQGPILKTPLTVVANDHGFFEFNEVELGLRITSPSAPRDLPAGVLPMSPSVRAST
jgi:hypothetical protein